MKYSYLLQRSTAYRAALVFSFFLFCIFTSPAQDLQQEVERVVQEGKTDFMDIFKTLHQNPELGFQEKETAQFIAEHLDSYGYTVTTGIGKTGVVGVLKNGEGPVVMYRTELDALPVLETTDLPYKSTKTVLEDGGSETPVMHACGHDAHMTWMLSAAKYFAEHKNRWKGTLLMLGQPAEEPVLGAEAMVNDGLYTKYDIPEPDYLYGLHSWPLPTESITAAKGTRMAGTDQLDITFYGVGGHGSSPHLAKDPVMIAVNAITLYQQAVSRMSNPRNPVVLTVGALTAGATNNVIPDKAVAKLNLRWFDVKDREVLVDAIQRINKSVAQMYDLDEQLYPEMKRKGWSYPLVNNDKMTTVIRSDIKTNIPNVKIFTEDDIPAEMGSEDFHHLVIHNKKKNYFYAFVGVVDPVQYEKSMSATGKPPYYNHNGNYQVDPGAIPFGQELAIHGLLSIFNNNFE